MSISEESKLIIAANLTVACSVLLQADLYKNNPKSLELAKEDVLKQFKAILLDVRKMEGSTGPLQK
jgi:hypothetical protein